MKLSLPTKILLHGSIAASVQSYCNWDGCSGVPQGCCDENALIWCNVNETRCEDDCGGIWCTNSFSYCSIKGCTGEIHLNESCNQDQSQCEGACGGEWCAPPSPILPAGVSIATTTRYWDCSGGSCGCAYIPTGLSYMEPAHCHSNAMFDAPADNIYGAKYYGTAAISASLGGGWMAEGCGKCWKVIGTSNAVGYEGVETTVILKGTNFCPDDNPLCAAGPHFDIAAPGFDVLEYSFSHVCPTREKEEAEGFASCSNYTSCDCSKFNSPILRKGCQSFYDLKWNNPSVTYEEVDCPVELSRLRCGYPYPHEVNMTGFCASNIEGDTVGVACGDGSCNMTDGETCSTCEVDCGVCPSVCGDGLCESDQGETCSSCEEDCDPCLPVCGDDSCDSGEGETCSTCEEDCGVCPPHECGDGVCDPNVGESCSSCAADCGECCGNGACDAVYGENCGTCEEDCGACPITRSKRERRRSRRRRRRSRRKKRKNAKKKSVTDAV